MPVAVVGARVVKRRACLAEFAVERINRSFRPAFRIRVRTSRIKCCRESGMPARQLLAFGRPPATLLGRALAPPQQRKDNGPFPRIGDRSSLHFD